MALGVAPKIAGIRGFLRRVGERRPRRDIESNLDKTLLQQWC